MKQEDRERRLSGDTPCSCSGDCDLYILALEADLRAIKEARAKVDHDDAWWGVDDLLDAIDQAG